MTLLITLFVLNLFDLLFVFIQNCTLFLHIRPRMKASKSKPFTIITQKYFSTSSLQFVEPTKNSLYQSGETHTVKWVPGFLQPANVTIFVQDTIYEMGRVGYPHPIVVLNNSLYLTNSKPYFNWFVPFEFRSDKYLFTLVCVSKDGKVDSQMSEPFEVFQLGDAAIGDPIVNP